MNNETDFELDGDTRFPNFVFVWLISISVWLAYVNGTLP